MTKQEIITKFELFIDDTTDLSSSEESDLFDKWYRIICNHKPWEFLKKAASGTLSTSLPYVSLPTDFSYLTTNSNYSESASTEASSPVVFVGSDALGYQEYRVISWSDRRQYRNQDGFCYLDIPNSRLYFTKQPARALGYEFDYKAFPTVLLVSETPLIPLAYQDALYHAMCSDDNIIQQSDKARSYKAENDDRFATILSQMEYWNANLIQQ